MSNHLNVSVVGTGYWGKHYVRILGPQCKLAVDPSEAAREKMVSLHPDLITSGKVEDAANNDDIQAWIVCTPAASHYNVVKAGLLAGKHVLVEKPLTLNVDHAKELISIAKENQLILMVGHTFLFNSR
jgi:UDP-2-acetamido-3-amino-2,3-dideoxy-glucuronate N-acetyltransferase